jgi:hypothetical protein
MKNFKFVLLLIIYCLSLTFFVGCDDSNEIPTQSKICPECNMPLPKDNKHTAYIEESNYFDDIGCLILWSKANRIDLSSRNVFVYSNDAKIYVNARDAHFTINEKTPMNYGFSAYAYEKNETINFEEMQLRMLRGEHLANPKIRKKILGY